MDLRDFFAAAALTGLLSNFNRKSQYVEEIVCDAYKCADLMMSYRKEDTA